MSKSKEAALQPRGFLLSEAGHEQLEQLRDQLFLMGSFVLACTQDEDDSPLQLRRSTLAQLFERFGLNLEEVIATMEWMGHRTRQSPRRH